MTFGPMRLTAMACEAGPASVESAVVTVLSGGVEYAIDADGLTLTKGDAGLMFRAAP
jgi:heat shock protein HslJ